MIFIFPRRHLLNVDLCSMEPHLVSSAQGGCPSTHYCSSAYLFYSRFVSFHTVPKPPGPLQVESQTTDSINVSWSSPEYFVRFTVFYLNLTRSTENNWFLLEKLESGTPYNISVVTVGPLDYQSTMVSTLISTSK